MPIKTVEGIIDLSKPDLIKTPAAVLQPGNLRGGKTANGGFYIEIAGASESRRADLSPREAVMIAKQMLASQGVTVMVDPAKFRHFDD